MSAEEYRWPSKEKHKDGLGGLLQEEIDLSPLPAKRMMIDEGEDCRSVPCRDTVAKGRDGRADATEYCKRLVTIVTVDGTDLVKVGHHAPLAFRKAVDGGQRLGIERSPLCQPPADEQPTSPVDCSTSSDAADGDPRWPKAAADLRDGGSDDGECCHVGMAIDDDGSDDDKADPAKLLLGGGVSVRPASENVAVRSIVTSAARQDEHSDVASPADAGASQQQQHHHHHHQVVEEAERVELPTLLDGIGVACADEAAEPVAAAMCSQPASPVRVPMQCSDDDCGVATAHAACPAAAAVDGKPAGDTLAWPQSFGERLRLVRMLGAGQFGRAYVAKWGDDMREVVIKTIKEAKYRDEEFFLPHRYPHENVVRMHLKMHLDRHVWLFQDYVMGSALDALWHDNVQRGRTLDDVDLDVLGFQMLDALRHLDAHRIVHRDIKPANIIRSYRYERGIHYVLIDFGFSEQLMDEEEVRCVDGFRGSLAYSAPECCRGCPKSKVCHEGYNTKADEWSLAVTLMQMCSFKVPWHHYVDTSGALLEKLLHQPELMQAYARDASLVRCTPWWRAVLVDMLSPRAAARPALEALLDGMDKKRQMSLPDFGALQDDAAVGQLSSSLADVAGLEENESCHFLHPDFGGTLPEGSLCGIS